MEKHTQERPDGHDIRCACGQLLARWTRNGLELKCKRCRRLLHITFESIRGKSPYRM